uniref:C3H1-type domain-containing protein n=1 Tax=Setaria digitata TaxID=48799 RepID=A0A915PPF5_9BILA
MAAVFQHPSSGDSALGYQLSEVPSLPPQPVPFLPAALPVIPPPQGTVYFQPPYIFPSGLPQPVFCEQSNVPLPSLENTPREETVPEVSPNAVFYPPPSFPIPFPPPVQPFPLFSPYLRPGPVLFVLPPFPDTSTPGNPLPTLPPPLPSSCPKSSVLQPLPSSFGSTPYQSSNQSSFKFSGNDDSKSFQRDNSNQGELMYRNKSGPSLNNYRTKLCINFKNGHCPYGDKCRFIHQQTADGLSRTKFSTNAPAFVPRANAMHTKAGSPSTSLDMGPPNRLYSSTPVSLLAKSQSNGLDVKERTTTPTGRRVSYRHDFSAGYRRPSVADGPHPLPAC